MNKYSGDVRFTPCFSFLENIVAVINTVIYGLINKNFQRLNIVERQIASDSNYFMKVSTTVKEIPRYTMVTQ